jgi:hypothetical protein
MSKNSLGAKLERPYENLKGGLKDAARGLTEPDPGPVVGMSGLSSADGSPVVPHESKTKDDLYAEARLLGIKGRSKMTKRELEQAIRRA